MALRTLGAEWTAPFVISKGGTCIDFRVHDAMCTDFALRHPTYVLARGCWACLWHKLCSFLRFLISVYEANRRPRDYQGLEAGWCNKEDHR